MDKTYLNGKITLSSLAAPTEEDVRKINALSDEDRKTTQTKTHTVECRKLTTDNTI